MENKKLVSACLCFFVFLGIFSCKESSSEADEVSFAQAVYEVRSGEAVTVKENVSGVTYRIKEGQTDKIQVDAETGVFTFDTSIDNQTEVLYTATYKGKETAPVTVVLCWDYDVPEIIFAEDVKNISDGNYIIASTSNGAPLNFELMGEAKGISIDHSTGLVSFQSNVSHGQKFEVKVISKGIAKQKEFIAVKENLAFTPTDLKYCEDDNLSSIHYEIDFSPVSSEYDRKVLGISVGNKLLDSSFFSYDNEKEAVTIYKTISKYLPLGQNTIGIITSYNIVKAPIFKITRFVKTIEDLLSINKDGDSLKGHYVLANDIDLTDYLSALGDGYNAGRGWKPIGIYHDTNDSSATSDSFKGIFDGNGHVVSGLSISRRDETGFNAGFFGYVTKSAVIKNLGVIYNQAATSKLASYSGGLVGVNLGTIRNCWVNANIEQPDGSYKVLGGFCGRNEGEISNCYAFGKVVGYEKVGAFAGQTSGENGASSFSNCYACLNGAESFAGDGVIPNSSCLCVSSYHELKTLDYSAYDPMAWNILVNDVPSLKSNIKFDKPYQISFGKVLEYYEKGDEIDLSYGILPIELYDSYASKVTLTCDDPQVNFEGKKARTYENCHDEIKFTVSLDLEEYHLEDSILVRTYDALKSIEIIDDNPSTLIPGRRYRLNHSIHPLTAKDDYKWSCPSIEGVTIADDIITIAEDVSGLANLEVTLKVGKLEARKEFSVKKINYLNSVFTAHPDHSGDVEFLLDPSLDLANARVTRYSKRVDYKIKENAILVDLRTIKEFPDIQVPFTFILKDGSIHRGYACYMSRGIYTKEEIGARAIPLRNIASFKKYFNIKDYDPDRFEKYYDKTFILENDVDFHDELIYGIGWYTSQYGEENQIMNRAFSGKFYGMRHTIKNVRVKESERYFDSQTNKTGAHRSSLYNVGFFGSISGEVHDVIFDNANVSGISRVGALAGSVRENGVISNVHFINSTLKNAGGTDHSNSTYITGRIASSCGGRMINCSFNGLVSKLVG